MKHRFKQIPNKVMVVLTLTLGLYLCKTAIIYHSDLNRTTTVEKHPFTIRQLSTHAAGYLFNSCVIGVPHVLTIAIKRWWGRIGLWTPPLPQVRPAPCSMVL